MISNISILCISGPTINMLSKEILFYINLDLTLMVACGDLEKVYIASVDEVGRWFLAS